MQEATVRRQPQGVRVDLCGRVPRHTHGPCPKHLPDTGPLSMRRCSAEVATSVRRRATQSTASSSCRCSAALFQCWLHRVGARNLMLISVLNTIDCRPGERTQKHPRSAQCIPKQRRSSWTHLRPVALAVFGSGPWLGWAMMLQGCRTCTSLQLRAIATSLAGWRGAAHPV